MSEVGGIARQTIIKFCVLYACTFVIFWPSIEFNIGAGLIPILIWISLADFSRLEIPDLASLALASLGIFSLLHAQDGYFLITVVLAALVLSGLWWFGNLYWRHMGREALGIGDAKLLAAGTLVVGAERFWMMLLLASLGGIMGVLISRRRRDELIPFGPFIAYSIFVTFITSDATP